MQALGSLQTGSAPFEPGVLGGMAVAVCSLPHGSMGRMLVSSMAEFKINFPLQF